jgi:hypothetical protein
MGVDFEDIMKNLANLNYAINVFATMFSRLNVPAGMPYVTKHMWMYENIYTDANTPRAQTYMFVPRSLYQYGYDINGAGKLGRIVLDDNFNSYVMNARTYDQIVQTMYDLLNPVIADEDIGTISGDILKAYGEGGVMKVTGVDFTYGITPVYNLEVLEIINNLTLLGPCTGDITQQIDVNTGWIKSTPTFEHYNPDLATDNSPGMNALSCDRFINFRRDNITPADSMVVTRMMNIADPGSYNPVTHRFTCKTIGSETAAFARIFWFGRATDQVSDPWVLKWTNPFTMSIAYAIESVANIVGAEGALAADDVAGAQTFVNNGAKLITDTIDKFNRFVELVSAFDYHPILGISSYAMVSASSYDWDNLSQSRVVSAHRYSELNGFVYDLANYAIVGHKELANLSEVALLNMFHVPMGKK